MLSSNKDVNVSYHMNLLNSNYSISANFNRHPEDTPESSANNLLPLVALADDRLRSYMPDCYADWSNTSRQLLRGNFGDT